MANKTVRHLADDVFIVLLVWKLLHLLQASRVCSRGPIHCIPALVQIMAWRRSGKSHVLNQLTAYVTNALGLNGITPDFTMINDDVIKWKHFPCYWPFVRGIHRSPVNSPQRPVTRSFDVFFDLRPNKRLSKQSCGWWLEKLSRPLWCHCNDLLHWNVSDTFIYLFYHAWRFSFWILIEDRVSSIWQRFRRWCHSELS